MQGDQARQSICQVPYISVDNDDQHGPFIHINREAKVAYVERWRQFLGRGMEQDCHDVCHKIPTNRMSLSHRCHQQLGLWDLLQQGVVHAAMDRVNKGAPHHSQGAPHHSQGACPNYSSCNNVGA